MDVISGNPIRPQRAAVVEAVAVVMACRCLFATNATFKRYSGGGVRNDGCRIVENLGSCVGCLSS